MTDTLNNEIKYIIEIEDFEDYGISEDGDVYSFKFNKIKKMKTPPNKHGYLQVFLFKNKQQYQKSVHRLLAQTFIPNPNNLETVDHQNRNRTDNRIENLRWISKSDNSRNAGVSKYSQSGIQGVGYDKSSNSWIATWYNKYGKRTKSFSANKYVRARALAIRWREQMVAEFYNRPKTP